MAYQPYDRNPSGIVFFGPSASDQVYESNPNFVYNSGTDTLQVVNLEATHIDTSTITSTSSGVFNSVVTSTIGSSGDPDALTIDNNGVVTFASGITVLGDLDVSGVVNRLTVNLQELLIEDNSIVLNSNLTGTPNDSDDASLIVNRGASSDVEIRWDEGDDLWEFTNDGTNYYPIPIAGSGMSYRSGSSPEDLGSIVDLDLNDLPVETNAANDDYIAIVDVSDSNITKKITRSNLLAGLGAMSDFSVSGDLGSAQTIGNGDNLILAGGSGIITTASSVDTITFDINTDDSTIEVSSDVLRLKASGITFSHLSDALVIASGESFVDSDTALMTAAAIADKIESYNYSTSNGTITEVIGGSGLSPSAGVTSGSVTLDVKVDDLTVGINGSDQVYVKDGGIGTTQLADDSVTEAKLNRTINTYTTTTNITHDIALASGLIQLTLPPADSGKMVFVKRIDNNDGSVVVKPSGTQQLDGAAEKRLYYQYESLSMVSDGANWFLV